MSSFFGKNKKADGKDLKKFNPTAKIGNHLWIDENNKLLMISTKMYIKPKFLLSFDDLISHSIMINGKTLIKSNGVGRAIGGGLLFGPAGAIVGAITGSSKDKSYVNILMISMEISQNGKIKKENIPFISGTKTKIDSEQYKAIEIEMQEVINALDEIINSK